MARHFFGENDDNPSTPYVRCTETYCEHGYHFLSTEEGRTTGEFRVFELRNKDGKPIGHQMCITSTPPNYTAFCTDYDNWWKLSTVGDRHYAERPNEQTRNKTIEDTKRQHEDEYRQNVRKCARRIHSFALNPSL